MIVITGQTATGKTNLSLEMAQKYNGELINFDSRQIYKYLDIITGKDLPKYSVISNQFSVNKFKIGFHSVPADSTKLWLYDVVTPNRYFSSYDYVQCANIVIDDIIKRGKTPILVGGSYFYLKHLLYGFDFKVPPNFKLREKLNKKSIKELQRALIESNKKVFDQMNNSDKNNPRRLIRKIEIIQGQNLSGSVLKRTVPKISIPNPFIIGLRYKNKEKLIKAIKMRVEKRLKQGAIEEVKKLLKMGYKKTDPGLKTIGYKQVIEYIERKITKKIMIDNWITAEVQYAKRQYTFMKKDKNIQWKEI